MTKKELAEAGVEFTITQENAKTCKERLRKLKRQETKITSIVVSEGVEALPDLAFRQLQDLRRCVLPSSLKVIPPGLFAECTSLTEVVLPAVEEIKKHAFIDCTSLKSVRLPDTLRFIHLGAFWGCEKLTSIRIPEGCDFRYDGPFSSFINKHSAYRNLKGHEFAGCVSLKKVEIPASMVSIDKTTFEQCDAVEFKVKNGNPLWVVENGRLKHKGSNKLFTLDVVCGYCVYSRDQIDIRRNVIGETSILARGFCADALKFYCGKDAYEDGFVISESEPSVVGECASLVRFKISKDQAYSTRILTRIKIVDSRFDVAKLEVVRKKIVLPDHESYLIDAIRYDGKDVPIVEYIDQGLSRDSYREGGGPESDWHSKIWLWPPVGSKAFKAMGGLAGVHDGFCEYLLSSFGKSPKN